jgi:eukaryotic-like serine/threonine-protein kinase
MTASKWQKVKAIFNSAVELPPEARSAYLAGTCASDNELRIEVEKLLDSYRSEFLESASGYETNDTRLTPGTLIGRYEIVRLLGVGGMGEVYLAKDGQLDRKVAVKVLNKKYENQEENIQRFIQEAKAASALNHPNILVIHEIGVTHDSHYIVSEYIDGRTLRDIFNERKLSISETLDIATQIASALSAAHAARIIHRDIKPENIIVRNDGYVKVVDFGLAKLIPLQPSFIGLEEETFRQNKTAQGLILGTVSYMSPEQARGEQVDERTDIFSLGVVIYEMIAGRSPFSSDSLSQTLANLLTEEPAALSGRERIPLDLERLVSKMLKKDRDERFRTARDLAAALRDLQDPSPFRAGFAKASSGSLQKQNKTTGDLAVSQNKTAFSGSRRWSAITLLAIISLTAVGLGWYWLNSANATRPQIRSLAVLPLENLSGDTSQEYFADGMTEALISNLSQIKDLKVISRTSVMRFKGSRESLPEIAKALGVDAVIEGSVLKAGDRVRVTAQLIHAATDAHMWAQNYERDLSDILKLQSDVSQAIAREVKAKLTLDEQNRLASSSTIDPQAHEAYLLAKFHNSKNSAEDIEKSISYFQRAIEVEPNYADAYAGLAAAWLNRGIWGGEQLADFESRVRDAATAAIRIDPGNANAHIAMCQLLNNYDYNWTEAEDEAKRALEIDPNSTEALEAYSWLLQSLGRHADVRPLMERAEQLDPVSSGIQSAYGRMLYRAKKYDEGEVHLRRSIELDPGNYATYGRLGDVYIEMGRFDDAIAQFEKSASIQPEGAHALRRAVVYARMGERKKALEIMAGISNRPKWEIARLYTALGESDKAFDALDEAIRTRDTLLVHIKEDPSFDGLHAHPRWKPLLRRLNFPME